MIMDLRVNFSNFAVFKIQSLEDLFGSSYVFCAFLSLSLCLVICSERATDSGNAVAPINVSESHFTYLKMQGRLWEDNSFLIVICEKCYITCGIDLYVFFLIKKKKKTFIRCMWKSALVK